MAAYRFWRVVFNSAGLQMTYRSLMFLDTPGGTDVTGSGTAIASGYFDTRFFPVNGFDRNSSTLWLVDNPANDQWLGYDFGTAVEILQVGLESYDDRPAKMIFVQASIDGATWVSMSYATPVSQVADTTTYYPVLSAPLPAPTYTKALIRDVPTTRVSGYGGGKIAKIRSERGDGGPGSIAGEVDIAGTPNTPVRREVRLHNRTTGALTKTAWSDAATGAYRFDGLSLTQTFYVVAFDYQLNYNAVVKDNVLPAVMP